MLDGRAFSEAVTNAFKPFPDENRVGLRHVRNRDCLRFIRLKNARGFAPGFSEASVRCPMALADGFPKGFPQRGLLEPPGETESGSAHDASETRDIQVPVRQWRVGPLMAYVTRGRSLEPHWTPDRCLRKSCGAAALRVTTCVCARFSRMNRLSRYPSSGVSESAAPPPTLCVFGNILQLRGELRHPAGPIGSRPWKSSPPTCSLH